MRRPSQSRSTGLSPLRRKPKTLDKDPALFHASSGGQGGVAFTLDRKRDRPPAEGERLGAAGPAFTDEPADLVSVPSGAAPDPETLRRAQQIAARLAIARPKRNRTDRRGRGRLSSVRYRGGSDEIDLDATIDNLIEHPIPTPEDIIVRERLQTRRAVVLLVDVSGSMRGERVRTAAATVGALAGEFCDDDVSVVAFWSDAAVLAPMGASLSPSQVLERLLRLPARGLTNVSFPLEQARRQLSGVASRDARVLLLSDCVHNAGPDPRLAASALPRLDVLLDTSGEHDVDLARELTRIGRGRLAQIADHRAVPPALAHIFGS